MCFGRVLQPYRFLHLIHIEDTIAIWKRLNLNLSFFWKLDTDMTGRIYVLGCPLSLMNKTNNYCNKLYYRDLLLSH